MIDPKDTCGELFWSHIIVIYFLAAYLVFDENIFEV